MPEADRPPRLTRVQRVCGGWVVVYLQPGGRWSSGGCTEQKGETATLHPLGVWSRALRVCACLSPSPHIAPALPNGLGAPSLPMCYQLYYAVADIPSLHHHLHTTTPLRRYPDLRTSLVCVPPWLRSSSSGPPTPPPRTHQRPKSGSTPILPTYPFPSVRFGEKG